MLQSTIMLLESALSDDSLVAGVVNEFRATYRNLGPDAFGGTPAQTETLADLAWDLGFYVSDTRVRAENPSYFGDERAKEEIRAAVEKLRR